MSSPLGSLVLTFLVLDLVLWDMACMVVGIHILHFGLGGVLVLGMV